jgi:phosphate starvation-inducible protein PhoH
MPMRRATALTEVNFLSDAQASSLTAINDRPVARGMLPAGCGDNP